MHTRRVDLTAEYRRARLIRIDTSHHKCGVWAEAADRTSCRMDNAKQLETLARALLGGPVGNHGRERAAHVLERLAEG